MTSARILLRLPILSGIATLALLSLSCFEQPVTERMEIRFFPRNAAMVRVTVKLAKEEQFKNSPAAQDRIESTRRDLLEARDPWTRRLAALEPLMERTTWDRESGDLVQADHRVLLEDAGGVRRFFSDTLLRADLTVKEKESEFTLVPEPGSRASRQQQESLKREMEKWAPAITRYLGAGATLYGYLERNPGRAEACFGDIFKDALSDEAKGNLETPSAEDGAVLEPFNKAMEEVLGIFSVPPESAFSLEELSRQVHDPFPAPLALRVPGPILEVEGFEDRGSGHLRVPTLSLWGSFTQISGRWLSPNPVVLYYEHLAGGKQPLDLEDFLRRPRSASSPPSPAELLQALQEPLKPAAIYRVRWSTEDLPEMEEPEGDIWDNPAFL